MDEIPKEEKDREVSICSILDSMSIPYEKFYHPKVMTVSEANLYHKDIPGNFVKNLFLKDKSNNYYLVTALTETKVDLSYLESELKCKKLRFANQNSLTQILNVNPGSVSPLAISQDKECIVSFVMDSNINEVETINVHPLHNFASFTIKVEDMKHFAEQFHHPITWINFPSPYTQESTSAHVASQESFSIDQIPKATEQIPKKEKQQDPNILGVQHKKTENFTEWYTQVITKSEMIEYYDISGCYIIRPWAFYIWETVQDFFDKEIKKMGVENCNFPLFVTKAKLEAEKDHIEGFSPEVAWVTHYGESQLNEAIAIRPTSETIMYPAYSKWIRSHRDLPLKLNQWNSVVRWEFKQPTPFLRSREFLWQEGHTAHTTKEEAYDFAKEILELYLRWYEEYLAVPVVKGIKSEKEKFSGGLTTTTIESYIQESGRGIQAATSHLLGDNFAKIFGIIYEDEEGEKKFCHQTSWGCSMRSLGVMVMVHGDDTGLILPPKVARIQVIIIPITYKSQDNAEIMNLSTQIKSLLDENNIRSKIDDRENYNPGRKYYYWETKGVPLRIEVGPREITTQTCQAIRRDTNERIVFSVDSLKLSIATLLNQVQADMLKHARQKMNDGIIKVTNFKSAFEEIQRKKLVLVPWCEDPETEEEIKRKSQALSLEAAENDATSNMTGGIKCLCIPFEQPDLPVGTKCFWTEKPAKSWSLWGRSY